jgi:prophage regulatory protein
MATEMPSFIRLDEVRRRVPYSKSSIYTMIAAGQFPAPHRLGARAVGWLEHEVTGWVRARSESEPEMPRAPRPPKPTKRKVQTR